MSRFGLTTLSYGRRNDDANAFTDALVIEAVDRSDLGLERSFYAMDHDGSGRLSGAELQAHIMKTYGRKLDDSAISQMLAAADTNHDGEVSLSEFKAIMRLGPYKSREPVHPASPNGALTRRLQLRPWDRQKDDFLFNHGGSPRYTAPLQQVCDPHPPPQRSPECREAIAEI